MSVSFAAPVRFGCAPPSVRFGQKRSERYVSDSEGIYPSGARALIRQGNPQAAIVGMVETLKKAASAKLPDIYQVQQVHSILADAFRALLPREPSNDNSWKLVMHATEARRLADILGRRYGRPDIQEAERQKGFVTTPEMEELAHREMKQWFEREGLSYNA